MFITVALLDFEGRGVNPEMYLAVKKAAQDTFNVDVVYGALYSLLKCALSLPEASLKQDVSVEYKNSFESFNNFGQLYI